MLADNIKRDYIFTLLVTVGAMGATVLLYKFAQSQFGTQGFSELSFVKRIIGFLGPIMAIGMGVGVPREVARVSGTDEDETKYDILRNSLLVTIVLFAIFTFLITVFSGFLTKLLFGDIKYKYLLYPMTIILQGVIVNSLAYSYFRGLDRFQIANCLQVVNLIILPIIIILFFSNNISSYFILYGSLISFTSLLFLSKHIFSKSGNIVNIHILLSVTRYSLKRLPGDIALQLMFVIPPIMTAHMFSFKAAGDVSFALTILTLIMIPFSPVSTLLLPKTMMWMNNGRIDILRKSTGIVFLKVAIGSMMLSIILYFGAEKALNFFLPERVDFDFFLMKAVTLVILPYSIYIYLRSFIDALHERAYNSINCLISLFVFLCIVGITKVVMPNYTAIAFGLIFGFYTLGVLTCYRIHLDRAIFYQKK